MFENITASEIAGYSVGALLLSATISASKLDSFVSISQRSSLGMCKRCGDLKMISCSKCKGSGLIKQRGPFDFITAVEYVGDVEFLRNDNRDCMMTLLTTTNCPHKRSNVAQFIDGINNHIPRNRM